MNVLVTSISKKVPLIEKVKDAATRDKSNFKVYVGDTFADCIGRYFSDAFWKMPLLENLHIQELIKYCKEHNIKVIFPSREGELTYFSERKEYLKMNNIYVMVSELDGLNRTQDKLEFYNFLIEKKYPVIKTRLCIDEKDTGFYVVKDRFGTGSLNLHLNVTSVEAIRVAKQLRQPIFQPYIVGTEYSIDVYVDTFGKSKGAIVRERVLVVNGESQITKTIQYKELESLAMGLAEVLGLYGHVMFQIIVDSNGNPHIIECNPRFGGASTLSIEAGLDSFYWFLLEAQGESLEKYPFIRANKELTQIRYPKDLIF
ncbi:carbamoyl-phosphate synthase [Sporosarcina sp. P2]|uniref:ATP-grasp domain-containing protein n=1 Tax=Sporosarcina sp. P2 TaxID=2048251 RepID=UPI000C16360F|nr:ATP-grasp domain-containing protein [Sporosarcina sp. P2]PID02601.1 carbamoyl-phosphate synthase [Sporosarcina sp. P2]